MRGRIVIGVALVFAIFFGQSARAAPETYDFVGWITDVRVLDGCEP